jgi:transcriptional regulator with XRE-family HTH domain
MNTDTKNAQSILLAVRLKRGIPQVEMARLLGISREVLANYETNRTRIPADLILQLLPELHDASKPENHEAV